jgi:hypothetical protein
MQIKNENLPNFLVGKTIKSVDTSAVNCTTVEFTDGTVIMVETGYMGHSIYGPVFQDMTGTLEAEKEMPMRVNLSNGKYIEVNAEDNTVASNLSVRTGEDRYGNDTDPTGGGVAFNAAVMAVEMLVLSLARSGYDVTAMQEAIGNAMHLIRDNLEY